jgi:hypothetical protein
MTPAEALYFLQHLPRAGRYPSQQRRYSERGRYYWLALQRLPGRIERIVREIRIVPTRIGHVDVMGPEVWTLQQRLDWRRLNYMIRHFPEVQRWAVDRLPIALVYGRRLIIWNGTHRMFAARLLGRKLRCRIVVLKRTMRRSARRGKAKARKNSGRRARRGKASRKGCSAAKVYRNGRS